MFLPCLLACRVDLQAPSRTEPSRRGFRGLGKARDMGDTSHRGVTAGFQQPGAELADKQLSEQPLKLRVFGDVSPLEKFISATRALPG